MQGKIRIAILCTLAAALVVAAAATYVLATGSDAQTRPEPRSITGAVKAPMAQGDTGSAGIAAANGFVYIVDSGTVYRLDGETLEVLASSPYKASIQPTPSSGARRITTPSTGGGAGE